MDALLPLRWRSIEKDNVTYYIKHHFGDSQYSIVVTDLRRVWSTKAYKDDVSELAASYSIVLETDAQMKSLLGRLKLFFQNPAQCELGTSRNKVKSVLYHKYMYTKS
ncbi:hypothetical protein BCR43DRAFT_497379 [Syncephalastrum racemosum]|uniref:XLF-like N-terminal domain-containing protein n=1 Tax=Syncephalastrum racemosum TaxID=13706 RepID=A0A1X2H221_SYNRA|nr:hypothetical protein BCR43DRAFT_497379 [Syncephalastrum racemosum]